MAFTIGNFFSLYLLSQKSGIKPGESQDSSAGSKPIQKPFLCFFAKLHTYLPVNLSTQIYVCFCFCAYQTSAAPFQGTVHLAFTPSALTLNEHHLSGAAETKWCLRAACEGNCAQLPCAWWWENSGLFPLPTLRAQSTINLFWWHMEVLLHYDSSSLVIFYLCCGNSLWPVTVWAALE